MSPEEVLRLSLTGSFFSHLRRNSSNATIIEGNSKYAESEWRAGEAGDWGLGAGWLVASQAGADTFLVRKWHKCNCSREALPCLVLAFWGVSKHFLLGSSEVWVCKVKTQKTEFQIKETGISLSSSPPSSPATRPSNSDADFWRRSSFDLGWHFTT